MGAMVRGTMPSKVGTCTSPPKGSTAKAAVAVKQARNGARVWRNLLALGGMKSSFMMPLSASARLWTRPIKRKPRIEARLAPMRSCMMALCLRSTQDRIRPEVMTTVMMKVTLIKEKISEATSG